MNSKGFEISVSFLVVMILAIVVFGIGIQLTYKVITNAHQMVTELDSQTKDEITKEMVKGNSAVVIPYNKKAVEKGGNVVFGAGIKNNLDPDESENYAEYFKFDVTCMSGYKKDNAVICEEGGCTDYTDWWANTGQCIHLQSTESSIKEIFIRIPKTAVEGTYLYILKVNRYNDNCITPLGDPQLGEPRTFQVTVK